MPATLPFKTYSFEPQTSKKLSSAVIIVLYEWWGVYDGIKLRAQKIADDTGARTIIPDVYKGKRATTIQEASDLKDNLDWELTAKELEQLVTQLRHEGYSNVGCIGFSLGGGISLALASYAAKVGNPLQAVVACYGTAPEVFDTTIIKDTPVQGHFCGKDEVWGFSDPATTDKLEADLKNAKACTIYRYADQGHAFLSDDDWCIQFRKDLGFCDKDIDPFTVEKDIRAKAWSRINEFLITYLK